MNDAIKIEATIASRRPWRGALFFAVSFMLLVASPVGAIAAGQGHGGSASSQKYNYAWIVPFDGKSTNVILWDRHSEGFLRHVAPARRVALIGFSARPLIETLKTIMGGPPQPVIVVDGRFVALAADRKHSAIEKGFIGIDMVQDKSLVGVVHYIYNSQTVTSEPMLYLTSKTYATYDEVPDQIKTFVSNWLLRENAAPTVVRFAGSKGVSDITLQFAGTRAP